MISYAYPGSLSITELQTQIQYAEISQNLNIVDVHVITDKQNTLRTLCDYKELDLALGDTPNPTFLVKKGDHQPAGTESLIFSDSVVAQSTITIVDFYR
jgi:hypothetical protein